jgi:hypothetical protein
LIRRRDSGRRRSRRIRTTATIKRIAGNYSKRSWKM